MVGIIFIGAPCSGKSTIAKEVSKRLHIPYISSGDIARKMAKVDINTAYNLQQGGLAPESKMRDVVRMEINRHYRGGGVIILDGFPRYIDQCHWLRNTFPDMEMKYIFINTDTKTAYDRLASRGRSDDTMDTFKNRMKFYMDNTIKILDSVPVDDVDIISNEDGDDLESIFIEVTKTIKEEFGC